MQPIAHIRSVFPTKFGIPRQAGLVPELTAHVIFEPEYRSMDAVRGLEGFSHIWLIWVFSANAEAGWSPTVRPPRLGGNERMGVFATRAPFRPNPLGLSPVKLLNIAGGPGGPILTVGGADLMDGTPILDIKPYVPTDSIPEASDGFLGANPRTLLQVAFDAGLEDRIPPEHRSALRGILAEDPRPAYQGDPDRRYVLEFAGMEIEFQVAGGTLRVRGLRTI